MTTEREIAWNELLEATPPGWYVGQPSYHDERREWLVYAFDPKEKPIVGVRKREWTAVAPTEGEVVLEMARCLRGHRGWESTEVRRHARSACIRFVGWSLDRRSATRGRRE